MNDPLELGFDSDKYFVIVLVAIGCGTAVFLSLAGMIASVVKTTQRRSIEMRLKQDMLDRGMSAEEIATVIGSASPPEDAIDRLVMKLGKK